MPGDVPGATWPRRFSLRPMRAGVRRRSIRVRYPVSRLIRVDRLARGPERDARTRAIPSVMLGRAHRARPWVRRRIAFAGGTRPPNGARIRIMRMGGAVGRSVVICCLVESIFVPGRATRASAVLAMSRLSRSVIVGVCRRKCCAVPATRSLTASCYATGQWSPGRAVLAVESLAVVPWTAGCISARRSAILKTHSLRIVLDHPMWCSTAHVGRHR